MRKYWFFHWNVAQKRGDLGFMLLLVKLLMFGGYLCNDIKQVVEYLYGVGMMMLSLSQKYFLVFWWCYRTM